MQYRLGEGVIQATLVKLHRPTLPVKLCSLVFIGLLSVTACGGGGGSSGSPTAETPNPAPQPSGNQPPQARISTSTVNGPAPLRVAVDGSGSSDPDGTVTQYRWQANGNTAIGALTSFTFTEAGNQVISLTVTDNEGASSTTSQSIRITTGSRVQVRGEVQILSATAVDADVNDRLTTTQSNNDFDNAQVLPAPLILGGYANVPGSGETTGNLFSSGDPGDFYRLALNGSETITLTVAERDADLDLRLWDEARNLVDSSMGSGANEVLQVPGAGNYFVEVYPVSGASNYVLVVGQSVVPDIQVAQRLSDPVIAGELILKRHTHTRKRLPFSSRITEQLALEDGIVSRHRLDLLTARLNQRDLKLPQHGRVRQAQTDVLLTLLAAKQRYADTEWAEPNLRVRLHASPDDPLFGSQWHYKAINLPRAWDDSTGSTEVIAAVIDTGVLLNHPDLQNQLVAGYDFISDPDRARDGDGLDDNPNDPGDLALAGQSSFHGTHVAGTLAAETDNRTGVAGTGWQTRIMPLRAIGVDGGTSFDVAQAILYAAGLDNGSGTRPARPADIINLSLGTEFSSQATQDAITDIVNSGIFVVASAGNDATDVPQYPAAYEGVLAVSATTISDRRASYSNYGAHIDLAAPGGSTLTDINGDGLGDGVLSTSGDDSGNSVAFTYRVQTGTSMAAPHVSGVIALMKAIYPQLTPQEFNLALFNGDLTDDLGASGRDDDFGWGLINAAKAVRTAAQLANGQSSDPGPILSASTAVVDFGAFQQELALNLRNIGTGSLMITQISSTEPWLEVQPPATADGLGNYALRVDRTGLADGAYEAQLTFASDANDLVVTIRMQVSSSNFGANAGLIYVILVDENNATVVPAITVNVSQGVYPFTIPNVPPGQYRLFAGTDADDDATLCDAGESCGAYPTLDAPATLSINGNQPLLRFESAFRLSIYSSNLNAESEQTGTTRRAIAFDKSKVQ